MSIRVLHVGKFYPPCRGGMERVLQMLCEGERDFVDSRALVANPGPRTVHEQVNGVPLTRVATFGRVGSVTICPTLAWWLRRQAQDVLVMHEPNPMALVAAAAARPRGHLVVWFHSEVVRPAWRYRLFYHPFLDPVLRRAARIVVSSPRLLAHAAVLQPVLEKCVVVPFGISATAYRADARVAARAAAVRAGPRPLVLFVGRLVPYKGVDVLLRALPRTEAAVVLVGGGPLRASLARLARSLGLEARVRFAGEVADDELLALYHACDVLVLPSVTPAEAFGYVQLEAMACGKPVISTALASGVPWVNRHGLTGLVVPPGDPDALGGALLTLLSDPELRRRLGANGLRHVEEGFAPAQMIAGTVSVYEAVTGRKAARPAAPGAAPPARVLR
jgi:glycosyltransferase involved in cell wall biosynthesis